MIVWKKNHILLAINNTSRYLKDLDLSKYLKYAEDYSLAFKANIEEISGKINRTYKFTNWAKLDKILY